MKIKETIGKYKSHPFWGRYGGSAWSAVTTSAFAAYNIFLGALFVSAWHISAGIYYAFLAAARCTLIVSEAKNFRESDRNAAAKRERRTFYGVSVFTFLINVALITPVSIMAVGKKTVNTGTIAAITVATYTTYKIAAACVRFKRAGKSDSLALMQLREIGLCDALFSVLSLQNTLISVFSEAGDTSIFTLSVVSSGVIVALIAALSFRFTIREIARLKKRSAIVEKTSAGGDNEK